MTNLPDFTSPAWLEKHIAESWRFYHPRGLDSDGGFYQFFRNDGELVDASTRNLVCSSRYVVNHAHLYRLSGDQQFRSAARHGVRFLHERHRVAATGGYRWQLQAHGASTIEDSDDNITYGIVFVVLAYAHAAMAGIEEARDWLAEAIATLDAHLWRESDGLYVDKASPNWMVVDSYRGQNCNMHACEAMLAAYEATGEERYLTRASQIAQRITNHLAHKNELGLVWEHYREDWAPDMKFNKDVHTDSYRPWGFLSGHQTEWAKLLLILKRHRPEAWQLPRAQFLFDETMKWAWDTRRGGMFYSCKPDRTIYDTTKHQWTHAETVAAAALLAAETGETRYWEWYGQLWSFIWTHLVDHRNGAWFRMLDGGNVLASAEKSAPEPDYHNIGACVEILRTMDGRLVAGQ